MYHGDCVFDFDVAQIVTMDKQLTSPESRPRAHTKSITKKPELYSIYTSVLVLYRFKLHSFFRLPKIYFSFLVCQLFLRFNFKIHF